jgi:predicted nicotinamide N-methyase
MPPELSPIDSLRTALATTFALRELTFSFQAHTFDLTAVDDPDVLLDDLIDQDPSSIDVQDERLPYWAWLWPSAEELTRVLLAGNLPGEGKTAVDLGCGLGLTTLAAMSTGADVVATDYQPDALRFTRLNCLANLGREPDTRVFDWRQPWDGPTFDFIIAADLAYEKRFFDPLQETFHQLLKPSGSILLGEPNRDIAKPFFAQLASQAWQVEQLTAGPRATTYCITRN